MLNLDIPYPSIDFQTPDADLPLGNLSLTLYGRIYSVLRDKSTADVDGILDTVSTLFDEWTYGSVGMDPTYAGCYGLPEQLPSTSDESEPERVITFGLYTLVAELFFRSNEPELQNQLSSLPIDWPVYFAAIALGYLTASNKKRLEAIQATDAQTRENAFDSFAVLLSLATEAVAYADRAAGEGSAIALGVKNSITERLAAAGKARHARTESLKARFVDFYASQAHLSKAEAARRFLLTLSESEQKVLSPSNAVRTLVSALKQ